MSFFPGKKYQTSGGQSRYDCHKCGDRKGRLYVNNKTGKFICFKCNWKGIAGGALHQSGRITLDKLDVFGGLVEEPLPYLDFILSSHIPNKCYQYLEERKVAIPDSGLQLSKRFQDRIAIPAQNLQDDGKVFYALRDWTRNLKPKVMFPKSDHINIAKKSICLLWNPNLDLRFVTTELDARIIPVICEGDFGAWSVFHKRQGKWYIGVATMGNSISPEQARFFKRFKEIFYMPDADVPFMVKNNNCKMLKLTGQVVKIFDTFHYEGAKDDANDLAQKHGNDWFSEQMFKPVL